MSEFSIIKSKDCIGHGYVFPGGKVVVQWYGKFSSIVIYDSIEDVKQLHNEVKFNNSSQLHDKQEEKLDSPQKPPKHLQSCPLEFAKLSP